MKTLHDIPCAQIDVGDTTFRMSFGRVLGPLQESIRKRGVLTPCLLRSKDGDPPFQIVLGFRRIEACLGLGLPSVTARVAIHPEMDDETALLTAVEENLHSRGLNLIERSMALAAIRQLPAWGKERIVREFLPAMGLHPSPGLLESYLSLLRLIDPLKSYVLREEVSLIHAERLSAFNAEDQNLLVEVLDGLKLTDSTLKEVLTLIGEILKRDGLPLESLFRRGRILERVRDPGLTRPQKTKLFRQSLWTVRYPLLQRMEDEFEKGKRALCLPPQISFQHSPYFEEEGIRVAFRFTEDRQLKDYAEKLLAASEREEIPALLDVGTRIPTDNDKKTGPSGWMGRSIRPFSPPPAREEEGAGDLDIKS